MSVRIESPLARRLLTVPVYLVLFVVYSAALPFLLAIGAVVDLARGADWTLVRMLAFFALYLFCETAGIVSSLALWAAVGPWTGRDRALWLRANRALQQWWGGLLGRGGFALFDIHVEVEADPRLGRRGILLLVRHTSVADTILAVNWISAPHGLPLRYVLKKELLWDPCLDIVGHRLPNVFIDRDSDDSGAEIARIAELLDDLAPREGVLIYPEGTRFTPTKKRRVIERFERRGDAASAAYARSLTHVLPPRGGGVGVLLERNPGLDVVVCAHTGLEGSTSFSELWNGGLVGSCVRIRLSLYEPEEIPTDVAGRRSWLRERWREVDAFVAGYDPTPAHEPPGPSPRRAASGARGRGAAA